MIFFNNYYRQYLGLKLLGDSSVCRLYEKNNLKCYAYFNGNKLVKVLLFSFGENSMVLHEKDLDYDTTENNTILLPKTSKGKPQKITLSLLESLDGIGTYFFIQKEKGKNGRCIIGNYTTQKTFYEDIIHEEIINENDLLKWLDEYVKNTSEDDLIEIQEFSKEKREHIKYKEGDYFRVKIGRHEYGYGRILMDISKQRKLGINYWDILMGKPLIIEMFHIITEDKNISIASLKKLPTFPSQHIMDNNFYYGSYEIIGNGELPVNIRYPIMYGKSISALNPNKVIFQCGIIHKEVDYNNNVITRTDETFVNNFRNNSIGYAVNVNADIIKRCLNEKSNNPFWEYYKYNAISDLRSPQNKKYLLEVLKQFNVDYLYEIYNNRS